MRCLTVGVAVCLVAVPCFSARIYVDDNAAGANNGTSWANAFVYLQDALALAAANGDATDEIWVAAGTYKPDRGAGITLNDRSASFQLLSGVAVYGGFAGTENALSQRDWEANGAILSGDLNTAAATDNSVHVVKGADGAVLDGFTITKGYADGTYLNANGGGMWNNLTSPTARNCTFVENTAWPGRGDCYGGAVFNRQSDGAAFVNCTFLRNDARRGGAIYSDNSDDVTLLQCTFLNNDASATPTERFGSGGACQFVNGSGLSIVNCLFAANVAENIAGAVLVSSMRDFSMVNCTVAGNIVTDNDSDGDAAGLSFQGLTGVVVNSIFWANVNSAGTVERAQLTRSSQQLAVTYSCIQDANSVDTSIPFGGTANDNIDDDPQFIALPDDGGDGWRAGGNDDYGNLHLRANSPCIDLGSNAALPLDAFDLDSDSVTNESLPIDLDGGPRVTDGDGDTAAEVDLGVYETVWTHVSDVDAGTSVTVNPGGGVDDPVAETLVLLENTGAVNDATVSVFEATADMHPEAGTGEILGSSISVGTSLANGEFLLTVTIPFVEADVTDLDPLLVDLKYFDETAGAWRLAVLGNGGSAGTRHRETGAAPDLATLHARGLGDYGVHWNAGAGVGFVWANVDYAGDFGASLKAVHTTDVDPDEVVTVNPGGGAGDPETDAVVVFENTSATEDATLSVTELESDVNQPTGTYNVVGTTLVVETSLNDGDFAMTLTAPFDDEDLGGADPLTLNLQYWDTVGSSWVLAAAGNTGGVGTRWVEEDADKPSLATLRQRPLGDYGVYWNNTSETGFVWANVDHTTEFAAAALRGDLNGDSQVDLVDLARFASGWQARAGEDPGYRTALELAAPADGMIDAADLQVLVDQWLVNANP